jgi:hypothetical protein
MLYSKRWLLSISLTACIAALLQAQSVVAQQTPDAGQQSEEAQPPGETEVLEPAEILPGSNSPEAEDFIVGENSEDSIDSSTEEESAQGTGRFIPSEEISQDLGVSFPVDI